MDWIREVVMRIVSAAFVCAVLRMIVGKKGAVASTVQMLTAIFMLLTILSPFGSLSFRELPRYFDDIRQDADLLVKEGAQYQYDEMSAIIKSRTEAYICDKAADFGAELSVSVGLSEDAIPVPMTAVLEGAISPYGKSKLSRILQDDLGIPTEAQTWTMERS